MRGLFICSAESAFDPFLPLLGDQFRLKGATRGRLNDPLSNITNPITVRKALTRERRLNRLLEGSANKNWD